MSSKDTLNVDEFTYNNDRISNKSKQDSKFAKDNF